MNKLAIILMLFLAGCQPNLIAHGESEIIFVETPPLQFSGPWAKEFWSWWASPEGIKETNLWSLPTQEDVEKWEEKKED